MSQFGGKDSKRHFTVVRGNREHGLYVSSTPSSAAKKAVTKLCAANKSKKVDHRLCLHFTPTIEPFTKHWRRLFTILKHFYTCDILLFCCFYFYYP